MVNFNNCSFWAPVAVKGSDSRCIYHCTDEAYQKVKDEIAAQMREWEKGCLGSDYYTEEELLDMPHARGC